MADGIAFAFFIGCLIICFSCILSFFWVRWRPRMSRKNAEPNILMPKPPSNPASITIKLLNPAAGLLASITIKPFNPAADESILAFAKEKEEELKGLLAQVKFIGEAGGRIDSDTESRIKELAAYNEHLGMISNIPGAKMSEGRNMGRLYYELSGGEYHPIISHDLIKAGMAATIMDVWSRGIKICAYKEDSEGVIILLGQGKYYHPGDGRYYLEKFPLCFIVPKLPVVAFDELKTVRLADGNVAYLEEEAYQKLKG